jgi:hypothetical protein
MKRILNFIFILIVSFLAFDGLEHLVDLYFKIDLHHILSLGGIGTAIILGFKFHIFCCAVPAIVSTIFCIRKRQKHCAHDHEEN